MHPVLIVIAVIVAGFVGLGILGALISPDSEPTATQTTQTTPEPTTTAADRPKPASSATDKPEAKPAEAKPKPTPKAVQPKPKPAKPKAPGLNQAVRDGDFTFTVTKVEYSTEPIGSEYLNTKPQGQFVLVHMTVANHGKEAGTFFGDNQYALDAGGRQFSADGEAAIYLEDSESLLEQINPGNKLSGIVVFDVPKGTKIQKLELHDSAFSDGAIVTVR
ncbi:DUF4352 domain-containing protein [Flindersiella endophytica]